MSLAPSFEHLFTEPLQVGAEAVELGCRLIDLIHHDDLPISAMPEASLLRLGISATVNARASLVCLRTPETSIAALTLLRGILEAWSHIAFITGGDQAADTPYDRVAAVCRALKYERGAHREWNDSVQGAPEHFFDEESWKAQTAENWAVIDALWVSAGCKGPARTRSHVQSTLQTLSKRDGFEWVLSAYRASSAATHMYTSDFALRDHGDGESHITWALPGHRAGWLVHVVVAYVSLCSLAALAINSPEAGRKALPTQSEMHQRTTQLIEHPVLVAAAQDVYDDVVEG